MTLRLLLLLLMMLSLNLPVQAQSLSLRNANQARKIIRTAKNTAADQKKAVGEIEKLIKGMKIKSDSTDYYLTNGVLKQYQLQLENNKLYLNAKPDTTLYFTHLYEMVSMYERCFPALDAKKSESKEVRTLLQNNRDNLGRGANYFLLKNDLSKAYQYFHKYIELSDIQLITCTDEVLKRAYYNCMFVSSKKEDYDQVVRLYQSSVQHGTPTEDADLLNCDALYRLERTEEWIAAVKSAIERNPVQFYFYASLIDYYITHNQSQKAVEYAEELQANDPENALKNFVQGYVYQQIGHINQAIECLERAYQLKADIPQNLSSLGYCYVAKAEAYSESLRGRYLTAVEKDQLHKYYTKASLYLERCRQLMPDKTDYWAPALYKVYYNLNKGPEMEEMERILSGR